MKKLSLCHTWTLPAYAQPYIQLNTDTGVKLPVTGEKGIFSVDKPPDIVTVCWGQAPLTQLRWQVPSPGWAGDVRVGGFVTSIHMTQLQTVDFPLAVITMEAHPLKPSVIPYLSPQQRDQIPYTPPDFLDGIDDETDEGVTTWIAEVDSPLVSVMQDVMTQGHRVYAFGQLASEEQGWQRMFALPILLESVTTFIR